VVPQAKPKRTRITSAVRCLRYQRGARAYKSGEREQVKAIPQMWASGTGGGPAEARASEATKAQQMAAPTEPDRTSTRAALCSCAEWAGAERGGIAANAAG
jgi:hypothetical protein